MLSGHDRATVNEESEDGECFDTKLRLKALERATARIEEMLGRLCGELDDGAPRSDVAKAKGTSTDVRFG